MKENSEKEKVGNEIGAETSEAVAIPDESNTDGQAENVDVPDPGDAGFGVPGGEEPIGW